MELPTKLSEIDLRFSKQKIGIIGAPGIGKSGFLAQNENAFFFDLEGGLNFLPCKKIAIRDWSDAEGVLKLLQKTKEAGKFPYDMIVLDTIDKLIDLAEERTIENAQNYYKKTDINVIGDIPEGKGWDTRRRMISSFIRDLVRLDCAVAFIGHLEIKRVEEEARKYDKSTISIGGKVGGDLLSWPDHTLHIQTQLMGDKLVRTVYTKPTQSREAKSKGGIVPDGWRWTDNDKDNWTKFRSLFK